MIKQNYEARLNRGGLTGLGLSPYRKRKLTGMVVTSQCEVSYPWCVRGCVSILDQQLP